MKRAVPSSPLLQGAVHFIAGGTRDADRAITRSNQGLRSAKSSRGCAGDDNIMHGSAQLSGRGDFKVRHEPYQAGPCVRAAYPAELQNLLLDFMPRSSASAWSFSSTWLSPPLP